MYIYSQYSEFILDSIIFLFPFWNYCLQETQDWGFRLERWEQCRGWYEEIPQTLRHLFGKNAFVWVNFWDWYITWESYFNNLHCSCHRAHNTLLSKIRYSLYTQEDNYNQKRSEHGVRTREWVAKFNLKGIGLRFISASISTMGWNTENLLAFLSPLDRGEHCQHLSPCLSFFRHPQVLTTTPTAAFFIEIKILIKQVTVKSYWRGCLLRRTAYLSSIISELMEGGSGWKFCLPYNTKIKAYSPWKSSWFCFDLMGTQVFASVNLADRNSIVSTSFKDMVLFLKYIKCMCS